MKKLLTILLLIFCSSLFSSSFVLTGRQIMERNDTLPEARSSKQKSIMLIIKGNRTEKKEFSVVMKKYGRITRTKMSFTYPSRLAFLVWDTPGHDSQQWIKLTSGKVRKIASSDRDKPWMNSHFYNEDIGVRDIDDYRYKLTGQAIVDGHHCYMVETRKLIGTKVYSKIIQYIGKDNYILRKIDFYIRGRHVRTLSLFHITKINGIYTPRKAVMARTDGKGKSVLYLKSVQYDVPVQDYLLNRNSF